jgi:hypothetical protein
LADVDKSVHNFFNTPVVNRNTDTSLSPANTHQWHGEDSVAPSRVIALAAANDELESSIESLCRYITLRYA